MILPHAAQILFESKIFRFWKSFLSLKNMSDRGLARVRGIHHLLGGNPRAMSFMFRQLDAHRLDHFELALADLADELEPCFQEQMTRLSPAQRGVMELLAESWRPLTVTEIAERSFSKQASTSGALRHLRRDALVQVLSNPGCPSPIGSQ